MIDDYDLYIRLHYYTRQWYNVQTLFIHKSKLLLV